MKAFPPAGRLEPDRCLRFLVLGVLGTMLCSGISLHLCRLDVVEHLPERSVCSFHALSGLPCPGCGMTRAVLSVGQGNLPRAVRFNPLALPLLAVMVAWLLGARIDARRHRRALWGALIALLVFWGLRVGAALSWEAFPSPISGLFRGHPPICGGCIPGPLAGMGFG